MAEAATVTTAGQQVVRRATAGLKAVPGATVGALEATAGKGQVGELCILADLQTPGWRWLARCTARSGLCPLPRTPGPTHLNSRQAWRGRSTRTRRSPHRAGRTPAPCRYSLQKCSTGVGCCRWRPGRSPHPEQLTARWLAVATAGPVAAAARETAAEGAAVAGPASSCRDRGWNSYPYQPTRGSSKSQRPGSTGESRCTGTRRHLTIAAAAAVVMPKATLIAGGDAKEVPLPSVRLSDLLSGAPARRNRARRC